MAPRRPAPANRPGAGAPGSPPPPPRPPPTRTFCQGRYGAVAATASNP